MNYSTFGGDAGSRQVRAYRNAALSTGSAGAWTHVAFDALSSLETANGYALSGGYIVPENHGRAYISGRVAYTGKLALVRFEVRIVVEPVGGGPEIVYDELPVSALTSGTEAVPFAYDPVLSARDKIRIDAASVGVGGATIGTGELSTWIKVSS